MLANYFAFLAIPRAGLALSQGVWGGVALVVSFIWGVYGPTDRSRPKVCLAPTRACFVYCLELSELPKMMHLQNLYANPARRCNLLHVVRRGWPTYTYTPWPYRRRVQHTMFQLMKGQIESMEFLPIIKQGHKNSTNGIKMGLLYAMCTGLFGGSILVPLELSSVSGLDSLPSFGHGVFLSSFLITILFALSSGSSQPLPKTARNIVPGIISGFIFNAGNTMSILAIPSIGFAVAQPLMQCALFVSGLLGIFLFKEIQDTKRIFVSLCVGLF